MSRVALLDTKLKENEAIDEALTDQRVLEAKRQQANVSAARSILEALTPLQCLRGLTSSKPSLEIHKKALRAGALFL